MPKLTIICSLDNFRRGGRAWPKGATEVDSDDLTKEQLRQLREEPALQVVDGEDKTKPNDKDKGKGK